MDKINLEEVCRYVGYKNNDIDEKTLEDIKEATEILAKNTFPKYSYEIFDIEITEDGVVVKNTALTLKGRDIIKLLSESKKCILMAVTLGVNADKILRQIQIKDMCKAVIYDACASSMIEKYCDEIEKKIREKIPENIHFTERFSPGYGDLELSSQKMLCKVLGVSKRIGLNVSSSGLLISRKSITAIIGLADKPQKMRIKGCKYCSLIKTCEYRKGGVTCD